MASFTLKFLPEYSDTAILDELRRVAILVGGDVLTTSEFSKHAKVSAKTLSVRFGSWPAALEAAGLAHLALPARPARKPRRLGRTLSDDQLIEEMRRVSNVVGHPSVTVEDLNQHAVVGVASFRNRFGSLKAALRAAGLVEGILGRRYSDEECFENLFAVWTHFGRPPTYDEIKLPPSVVGPKAYTRRWRTWRRALAAFVGRVNSPDSDPKPTVAPQPVSKLPRVRPEDKHHIPLSLRYRVLKRDSFRCVLSGHSPATTPGIELHVDHIIPFSKGGKTIEANLRTLCSKCNLGKGACD
jgi:hypothetical protein